MGARASSRRINAYFAYAHGAVAATVSRSVALTHGAATNA